MARRLNRVRWHSLLFISSSRSSSSSDSLQLQSSLLPGHRQSSTPGHMGSRRSCTRSARLPRITAARSAGCRPTVSSTILRQLSQCLSAGTRSLSLQLHSRDRLLSRKSSRSATERSAIIARSSSYGSSSSCSLSVRSRTSRHSRSGLSWNISTWLQEVSSMSDQSSAKHASEKQYALYKRAVIDAFLKLDPRNLYHNVVMFTVEIGSVITTLLFLQSLSGKGEASPGFIGAITAWLWFTVLFANFAEALAEGRGKAQAEALRKMRRDTEAKKLYLGYEVVKGKEPAPTDFTMVSSLTLLKSDLYFVKAGDTIPVDGEIVEGVASVNESAITGESAPVIRESGGDRSAVTGGTVILSDWLIIRAIANPGEGFLDHMISLIEGAKRQKTPNEIALNILLVGLTAIFVVVCASLWAFSVYSVKVAGAGVPVTITVLVALFVCLAPTTIGGLLSAIGIAGMDRLIRRNVITTSGRAIEAAGDIDVLLLDKTGTITLGNRQAVELKPVDGTDILELAETAQLASLADETPEGRSIVVLAKEMYGLRGRTVGASESAPEMQFIPFSSHTRMSGIDQGDVHIRKGAADAIFAYVRENGNGISDQLKQEVDAIARAGGTPLVVTKNGKALGVINLKDIVKGGIKERFAQLRRMGIKTIMIL